MIHFSKKLALSSAAAVLLAGGGWMWLQEASAAISVPRPGTRVVCAGSRSHIITVNQGVPVFAGTAGAIEAVVGKTSTNPQGHQVTELTVTDTYTNGRVEGIGNVAITLDAARTAPPSTLTANQKGAAFPATQVMRFYPVFVLNDEVFKSNEAVEVVSSSVTSFPPAPGTTYVLTNAMTLKSDKGNTLGLEPGKAFTITGSK